MDDNMRARMNEIVCPDCRTCKYDENTCDENVANILDALIAAGAVLPKYQLGKKAYGLVWGTKRRIIKSGIIESIIIVKSIGTIYGFEDDTMGLWSEANLYPTEAEARAALEEETT